MLRGLYCRWLVYALDGRYVGCLCVTGSGIVLVTSLCAVVLVEGVAVGGWVW